MAANDYYETLGLSRSATEKEIKSAYRKLARKYHPDVNPGDKAAEDRFKKVSEAYEVLRDTEKRAAYDRFGPQWQQYQRAGASAGGPDFDGSTFHFEYGPGEQDFQAGDFGDVFETLFGGGARHTRTAGFGGFTPPKQDAVAEVEVTLEEAYSGSQRQVTVGGKRLSVKIPPGVQTGSRIRVAGKAPGRNGEQGDLYLNVTVRPHPTFKRDGEHLQVDVQVPYTAAALGGEIAVPTMTGKVSMKVPAGVQSGQTLRLSGKGMPNLKGGGHGDLLARVMIVVPKSLSAREKELLTEIAGLTAGRSPS